MVSIIIFNIKSVYTFNIKYSTLRIANVDKLKTRLINERSGFDQSIAEATIGQWRRRLRACVRVRGAHFERL